MLLVPLQQWVCDMCHELIAKPEDGWLEWLSDNDGKNYHDFRIVHHCTASPLSRGCYRSGDIHRSLPNELSHHLDVFVGFGGMLRLLYWMEDHQVRNTKEWTELFKRMFVPHYEESRLYWPTDPDSHSPAIECLQLTRHSNPFDLSTDTLRAVQAYRDSVEE